MGYQRGEAATLLGVSYDTMRGWEVGRRALSRVSAADMWRHEQRLLLAGADPELVGMLGDAVRADLILGELGFANGPESPLASLVPGRTLTELLAWPISGKAPRALHGYGDRIAVQFPTGERRELVAALRRTADTAPADEQGAMLHRQSAYLAAADPDAPEWAAEPRNTPLQREAWGPEWPVQRSRAISAAAGGDIEALQRFVDTGLASQQAVRANLTYWAYWVGEIPALWRADTQMVTTSVDSWPGHQLLCTLTTGLVEAPYAELCAYTLHALIELKPHLVPAARSTLDETLSAALDNSDRPLSPQARNLLKQAHFLVRSYR